MKNSSLFFLLVWLCGCSNDISGINNYKLIRPELHLGEYVQVMSSDTVVTVSRNGSAETLGLVSVNLISSELTVLDKEASEARDILTSHGIIAYRIGTQLRLFDKIVKPLSLEADRLRTFSWFGTWGRITFDSINRKSEWATIKDDGTIIASGVLRGSARNSIVRDNREMIFQQTNLGLFMSNFDGSEKGSTEDQLLIPGPSQGAYVSSLLIGETLYIASFDENEGALVLATKAAGVKIPTIETIESAPAKTYRGLDVTLFNDQGKPGLLYLDGWALRLRMARLNDKVWATQELPFKGATGFYPKVVSQNGAKLKIVFHNFRTSITSLNQSFEDLVYAEI